MSAGTLVMRSTSCSDSESDSYSENGGNSIFAWRLPIIAVVGVAAAAGLLCVLATSPRSPPASLLQGLSAGSHAVELASFRGAATDSQPEASSQARPVTQLQQMRQQAQQMQQFPGKVQALVPGADGTIAAAAAPQAIAPIPGPPTVPQAAPTSLAVAPQAMAGALAVAPKEHLHDGNACADDEEMHAGLCYNKCSILTSGQYKVRQSAWTCCEASVCNPMRLITGKCCRHHMGFCSGFDIAGLQEGDRVCPHKPGACLEDEELFLDLCFMKCSLLTQGTFPHRVAASTCCKVNGMSCLLDNKMYSKMKVGITGEADTNSIYNVGGGCGDGRNITHCRPHEPQQFLTEATS